MFSLKKIRINILFIIGLSTILILLTLALAVISLNSVSFLGQYAIKVDEENTNHNAEIFFWEITRRTAGAYSIYFSGIEDFVNIIGRSCQEVLSKPYTDPVQVNRTVKLEKYKGTDLYIAKNASNENIFYWGDQKNLFKAEKEVYNLRLLKTLLSDINKRNSTYIKRLWIHTMNDLEYEYPAETYLNSPNDAKILINYYKNIFKRYSVEKNSRNHEDIKAFWGKPYKDISGEILFTAYSPVYNYNGELISIAGIDIYFMKLVETMANNALLSDNISLLSDEFDSIYDTIDGFLFIIDEDGYVLLFPENYSKLFSLPKNYSKLKDYSEKIQVNLTGSSNPKIKKLALKMCENSIGVERLILGNQDYIVAYCVVPSTGWRLGFVTKEKSLLRSIEKTKKQLSITESNMSFRLILTAFIYLVLSIIASIIFFRLFFFNPLKKIRNEIKKMGDGNFDISLDENGAAEISELSAAFNYLGREIRDYMENLKKEVSARQAVETEIKLAGKMQQSILPQTEKFSKTDLFELAAKLEVAKDISGDFYDFFYVDKNKIALVVGDVSGKGFQAAFFMAMSKVLIKNYSLVQKGNPALILEKTNHLLCLDNKVKMFTTVFLAFYEIDTGKITYANAGHHASIIVDKNGGRRKFGVFFNTALGFFSESKYKQGETVLKENELLVLFTDGLTEANCMNKDPFGEDRLINILHNNYNFNLEKLSDNIVAKVLAHEKEDQHDDITLILLRRRGAKYKRC